MAKKLIFRYGAMGSGKSALLQQVAFNYEERGMNIILLKPSTDTKGDNKVVSRIGLERKVDFIVHKDTDILKILGSTNAHCIIVDEAQFLTREQVEDLSFVASICDIPVICYGLRTDFMGNGFEGSSRLLELADNIEEMKTICSCGKKATMNARKINGEFTFSGEQVCIDNQEEVEYISLCPKCYYTERGLIE